VTQIRYHGPASEGVDVVLDGGDVLHMARLAEYDVPTDLARSLLDQEDNFERPPRKAKRAAKKRGGKVAAGEPASVGDSGPELSELPEGSVVIPADNTNNEES
jgi:hypothetical protein